MPERDILAIEYRDTKNNRTMNIVGVKSIELLENGILIRTEDQSKNVTLAEDELRKKDLKMTLYYPDADDMAAIFAVKGMFGGKDTVVDGRLRE